MTDKEINKLLKYAYWVCLCGTFLTTSIFIILLLLILLDKITFSTSPMIVCFLFDYVFIVFAFCLRKYVKKKKRHKKVDK